MIKLSQIPYLKHGRTVDGADCYGFVRIVLQEAGIVLPAYDFKGCGGELEAGIEAFRAVEVENPENFNLVYLVTYKNQEHIGVYLDGSVWHMTPAGVLSKKWKRIKGQVKGVYRVKG